MQLHPFFLPLSIAAMAATLCPATAQNFYIEGAVGAIDETTYSLANDSLDTNLVGGRIGWEATPYFAVEGEYFAGLNEHTDSSTARTSTGDFIGMTSKESIASTYGVFGKASVPVGDSFELFARVGYANVEKDGETRFADESNTTLSRSVDIDDIAVGIGASFDLTDRIYARLDATSYDPSALDTNSITIGAGFRF